MNPIEDKVVDEYLAGDSPFSRRYRETPAHDVPPELDAKILAASKAPARRSALGRWRVWSAPVALAATLVIAVAVILRGGIEHAAVKSSDMQEQVVVTTKQEMIAPAAPPAAAPPAAAAPEQRSDVAASTPAQSVARDEAKPKARPKREEVQAPLPIQVAPMDELQKPAAAAPAPEANRTEPVVVTAHKRTASDDLQSVVVTGAFRQAQPAAGAGPHNSVQPAEKSEATLEKDAREADPREWLEYIRDLRKNNDIRAADREWKKFVKAYPDYAVPEDDLARPPTK